MNLTIFGGLGRRPFAPGWTKQTVVAIFGGGELDLSASPPGPGAVLTVVAILGGMTILLAPGTRVTVSGFAIFGGREVNVSPRGDGPEIALRLCVFIGGVEVKEPGMNDSERPS